MFRISEMFRASRFSSGRVGSLTLAQPPGAADTLMMATTTRALRTPACWNILSPCSKRKRALNKWVAVGTGKALEIAKTATLTCCWCMPRRARWNLSKPVTALTVVRSCMALSVMGPAIWPGQDEEHCQTLGGIFPPRRVFCGRGDQSGTHKAEKLWKQAQITPDKDPQYFPLVRA